MWVWYNDKLLKEKDLILHTSNRAFQYGDGIFETIIVKDNHLEFSDYHKNRISYSTKTLHLNFKLSFDEFTNRINFLLKKNKVENARVKLVIWRAPGGYYIPESEESEFLITLQPLKDPNFVPQSLGVSQTIRLPRGLTKNCKTLNSLPYILAGLELKKSHTYDDLVILDIEGKISECISSNIFWIKNGIYFTPSLETNCVMGIRRAFLIDQLRERQMKIEEVQAPLEEILNADYIFKTNVTGVYPINKIEDRELKVAENFFSPK